MTGRKTCIAVAIAITALDPADCVAKSTGNGVSAATQEAAMTGNNTDAQVSETVQETVMVDQTGADTAANAAITLTGGPDSQVSVRPTGHAAVLSSSSVQAWMLADGQLSVVIEDIYLSLIHISEPTRRSSGQ